MYPNRFGASARDAFTQLAANVVEASRHDADDLQPPAAPLAMPAQPLHNARVSPGCEADGRWRLGTIIAAAAGLTTLAGWLMHAQIAPGGVSALEAVMLVLFCLNFAWISAASATAGAGLVRLLQQERVADADLAGAPLASRTAIIIPLYNEEAARVMGAAEATFDALRETLGETSATAAFDVFFLSDTTDERLAAIELSIIREIRARRPGQPFFYRRRRNNRGRKAGNVTDFLERWGARYDHMIVFDADSLMTPQALVALVRRMEASPRTALIQTLPVIVNARTGSARAQQFAQRAYGQLFGSGMAWWSGGAGNFWGHNAIVRVAPFAAHARLPRLEGQAPLGGDILSHDFVEAALLRRAGWRVEIAPDIDGSYEECPPTLVDMAARDRRWAQGNLQHLSVIAARGLDWVSRAHLIAGVMGYLSAGLWLVTLFAGAAIVVEGALTPSAASSPHGVALALFVLTAGIVLSPKWMAVIAWAADRLPGWSRDPRFLASVTLEAAVSSLTAPVMMVSQAGAVVSTLLGRDAGWRPQVRDRNGFDFADLARCYTPQLVLGAVLVLGVAIVSPSHALMMAPLAGSLLAAPLIAAWLSQRAPRGSLMWRLLATPEDERRPDIVRAAERASAALGCEPADIRQARERRRARQVLADARSAIA